MSPPREYGVQYGNHPKPTWKGFVCGVRPNGVMLGRPPQDSSMDSEEGRYVTSSPNTREPLSSTKSCTYWKHGRTSPWVLSFPHLLGQEHLEPLPHVGKEGIARSGRRSGSVLFLVYRGRDSSFGRLGARSWVLFVREISGYYWIKIKQVYQNDTKKFWSTYIDQLPIRSKKSQITL